MSKAVLSNMLWVPTQDVRPYVLDEFTYTMDEENPCDRCTMEGICDQCPFQNWTGKMYTYETHGQFTGLYRGNMAKCLGYFTDFDIIDQRSRTPFSWPLRFTGREDRHLNELWDYQLRGMLDWWNYKYGQIKAPARSGKTVVMTSLCCALGGKTVVFAHTEDLLLQYLDTFEQWTNVLELRRHYGRPIVGIVDDIAKLDSYDVALMTHFKWNSKIGQKHLQWERDRFATVIVDECHRAAADTYLYVLNQFNPLYRLGNTATPNRKDGMELLSYDVLGPVVAEIAAPSLRCQVYLHHTGYKVPKYYAWHQYVNRTCANEQRNRFIVERIAERVQQGHSVIAISPRKQHCFDIANTLSGMGIAAEAFTSETDRNGILARAKSGETTVVVAIRQLATLGLNVPRWSNYHCLFPVGFEENYYQECARCRTRILPYDGVTDGPGSLKIETQFGGTSIPPIIDYYMDDGGPSSGLYCKAKIIHNRENFNVTDLRSIQISKSKPKGWCL